MKIKMLCTVRPSLPFAPTDTILVVGETYEATANKQGAVCGICNNGAPLGVKPCEFEFLELPQWLYDLWAPVWSYSVEHAKVVEELDGVRR